jgi:hypothetical protein
MPNCDVKFSYKLLAAKYPDPLVKGDHVVPSSVYFETEYRRQLKLAQDEIRKMKIVDWIKNRTDFMNRAKKPGGSGRDPKSAYRQKVFRIRVQEGWKAERESDLMKAPYNMSFSQAKALAAEEWKKQAALHPLDQVAGGGLEPTEMGDKYVNSSIGSTWKDQVDPIYQLVIKIDPINQQKWNMNVTILLDNNPV